MKETHQVTGVVSANTFSSIDNPFFQYKNTIIIENELIVGLLSNNDEPFCVTGDTVKLTFTKNGKYNNAIEHQSEVLQRGKIRQAYRV